MAGTFDGLHPGHDAFLRQAKRLGDELVVIVARNRTAERHRGYRPRLTEPARLSCVRAHPLVDRAVLGSLGTDYLVPVVALRPKVLALGYDQWPDEQVLRRALDRHGLARTTIVRLKAYEPNQFHSSLLK